MPTWAAEITPAIDRTRSSSSRCSAGWRSAGTPTRLKSTSTTTMSSGLKPVSSPVRLRRLDANSSAPVTITSDSATCATTSARCHPRRPRFDVSPRPDDRITASSGADVPLSAGSNPKSVVVTTAVTAANPRRRQSGARDTNSGSRPVLRNDTSVALITWASTAPSAAPSVASSRLSDSNWRTRRPREAPVASRTAISRLRAPARASRRFAMLAHAVNRTSADRPRSSHNGVS